jgi:hypothetical protein
MKILIAYHCLLYMDDPPELRPMALSIISEQMEQLRTSGLLDAADEMIVGVNGAEESVDVARVFIPAKARLVFHGLQCRNECRTIVELERWLPGHDDWYVLYFHAKGCTHGEGPVLDMRTLWRRCMDHNLVCEWRRCVAELEAGWESVGCHRMEPPATPPGQFIWAGNFWWAKASFLLTLPPLMERARIKQSGIDAAESRYEAEVWIGNGPRQPLYRDYHGPGWNPSLVHTCA